jgi:hypothetical protein
VLVLLSNSVRAERIYPALARFVLGETSMPFWWEYRWARQFTLEGLTEGKYRTYIRFGGRRSQAGESPAASEELVGGSSGVWIYP